MCVCVCDVLCFFFIVGRVFFFFSCLARKMDALLCLLLLSSTRPACTESGVVRPRWGRSVVGVALAGVFCTFTGDQKETSESLNHGSVCCCFVFDDAFP